MDAWQTLLEQIRQDRELDLSSYKSSFLERRLAVRMRARGCPNLAAYGRLLRQDPAEYTDLLDALSINLTRFFRDASTFQALEERFLPELLQRQAGERRLRAWSAGCAAGEEPYSLAILVCAALGPALPQWRIEILGSDIDAKALQKARAGQYDSTAFQDLPPRYQVWIERYFSPGPQRTLAEAVRSLVTFQQHDLTRDPFPTDLDLVLCRNVLIYFERDLQNRLYRRFFEALRPEGLLVLGKTEILPLSWGQSFAAVDLREHIYRRKDQISGA